MGCFMCKSTGEDYDSEEKRKELEERTHPYYGETLYGIRIDDETYNTQNNRRRRYFGRNYSKELKQTSVETIQPNLEQAVVWVPPPPPDPPNPQ